MAMRERASEGKPKPSLYFCSFLAASSGFQVLGGRRLVTLPLFTRFHLNRNLRLSRALRRAGCYFVPTRRV